jgi:glycosyltransferase involved in cell wall biosynthesis
LAKVHRNVIDGLLAAGHEVCIAGWFAFDTKTTAMIQHGYKPQRPTYKGIEVLPMAKNENAPLAAHDICKIVKPDVVLTIGDHWSFYYMHAVKNKLDYKFKWVSYLTVEEENIDTEKWKPLFRYMDAVIVPTEFGKTSLSKIGVEACVIPYGVDAEFNKLTEERRSQLREERGLKNEIRFITVAQNTLRKNLPSILQTAQQLKTMDQYCNRLIRFHIHTNIGASDPNETCVYDLQKLCKQMDVEDMVTFSPKETSLYKGSATELLRDEYNASDFYLCTSISEGYCLPVVEAMACGIPCIANGSSTLYELVGVPYGKTGWGPRGKIFKSRVDVLPPARFVNMVDPVLLAKEVWYDICFIDRRKTETDCEDYARRSTWEGMGKGLAEVIAQMDKGTVIPVEEF